MIQPYDKYNWDPTNIHHSIELPVTSNAGMNWVEYDLNHDEKYESAFLMEHDITCDKSSCTQGLILGSFSEVIGATAVPFVAITKDQGQNWSSPIKLTPPPSSVYDVMAFRIKCNETMQNCLIAAYDSYDMNTNSFTYTSTNGGLTWSRPNAFATDKTIFDFYCDAQGKKCVALDLESNRYLSNDGGNTWGKPKKITSQ